MSEEQARWSLLPNHQQRIRRAESSSSSCVCFPRHAIAGRKQESSRLKFSQPQSHEATEHQALGDHQNLTALAIPQQPRFPFGKPHCQVFSVDYSYHRKFKYKILPNISHPISPESLSSSTSRTRKPNCQQFIWVLLISESLGDGYVFAG